MGTAAKLPARHAHHGPVLCPPESPDHGAMQGALRARQDCAMGRSYSRARTRAPCFRARIRAPCFRARTRAPCFRARIRAPCFRARTRAPRFRARTRATQRENKWSAAGGARGRARTCSARTALCDARVIPYAARTTLSGAPATFQARATRARAILRRGIPLIPLNPAESRFQFKFCRRCEPESDRDPGEKFVPARNSYRRLGLWTIDRLSQSFAACARPLGLPSMSLSHCSMTDRAP